jgi:vacuolar-type H+-ATPase subunit H
MKFLDFLDGLEEILSKGKKVPGTKQMVVERQKVATLVDQLRTSVPQEVHDAKQILIRGESIVKGAENIAKQIHSDAVQEHRKKIDDSEVLSQAHEEALQIKLDAEKSADQIRNRARSEAAKAIVEIDQYSEQSLTKLESQIVSLREQMDELHGDLTNIENSVDAGKKYLMAKRKITKTTSANPIKPVTKISEENLVANEHSTIMETTKPYQIQMNGLKNHAS